MKRRIIKRGIEARSELAEGAKFLAEAVTSTLGPFGQNWFLDKGGGEVTNDGKKTASEIQITDNEIKNRGAKALREAAIKTDDEVGDGTTTAIALTWEIYKQLSQFLKKEGQIVDKMTPASLRIKLEQEKTEVLDKLTAMATPIETQEDLINSAIVSTEDKELGKMIGEAQWELGKDGRLIAEETAERVSSVEKIQGVRIDNGFGTSMVINNIEKGLLELSDIPVILTSYTIDDFTAIENTLNQLLKSGKKELVIIARAWTENGIKACQLNHQNGFKIYPISGPYVDMQQRFLDLQAVTGAKFYDSEGSNLSSLSLQDIGFARMVRANRYEAIIAGSNSVDTQVRVATRVGELKDQLSGEKSDFMKKMLEERISQMQNGLGIVKVGSVSEIERSKLLDKAEDAVNAVRAAFQEGTVKGGGLAFKEIADGLTQDYLLKQPLMCIYNQIMSSAPEGFVIEEWVRDPVKVLRIALNNACTTAMAFATAGGVITEKNPSEISEILKTQ